MNIVLVVPAVLFVTPLASRLSITCWDSLEVYAFMKHVDTPRLLSSIGNEKFIQYPFVLIHCQYVWPFMIFRVYQIPICCGSHVITLLCYYFCSDYTVTLTIN